MKNSGAENLSVKLKCVQNTEIITRHLKCKSPQALEVSDVWIDCTAFNQPLLHRVHAVHLYAAAISIEPLLMPHFCARLFPGRAVYFSLCAEWRHEVQVKQID